MNHENRISLLNKYLPFRRIFLSFSFIFALLLVSACQPAAEAAPAATVPAEAVATPTRAETPTPQPTPTTAAIAVLSDQPYDSPSGAFQVYLPKDWNCSETGLYRVDCQPPDGKANISLRATATGYELAQPAFEAFANAEMVTAYNSKKVYTETSRETKDGSISINAAWREGEISWQSRDVFTRSGAGAFQLSFSADAEVWEEYANLIDEVQTNMVLTPQALSGAPMYALTRKYTSPDVLFTLEVPTSWSRYGDIASIENAQLEGFLSPDLHASIQVVVYRQGSLITVERKAFKTLEIMRKIYGSDLKISHDKALPDGRERLAWSAARRKVSGISYFDSYRSSMYIFSIVWDDAFEDMYMPILDAVDTSFGYE